MPLRIFYSWQSDIAPNRNFVRSALDIAVAEIKSQLAIDEAERDIIVDQDTQGVPGSPGIADANQAKIRATDIFVADLTFIDEGSAGGRRTPNPNVMLEYGYALHSLGEGKIVGVFNDACGSPDGLPFDLGHRRWPIRFHATREDVSTRDDQKRALAKTLKEALSSIISQFGEPAASIAPFAAYAPQDGIGRLRADDDPLCLTSDYTDTAIQLASGPYLFLRLIPTQAVEELGEVEAYRIAQQNLTPMSGMRGVNVSSGRHQTGAVVYWTSGENRSVAIDATELFLTRELWANSPYYLGKTEEGSSYIATGAVEEVLIDTFINFRQVARDKLDLSLPIDVKAGLVGVKSYRLAVKPEYFGYAQFAGKILRDSILFEKGLTDWACDPFDFLKPLFEKIYDAAGIERPDVRTVGRRQR